MRKTILVLASLIMGFGLQAQEAHETEETGGGEFFVTGAVGFSSEETQTESINRFEFAPSLGYFFTEHVAAGIRVGYESEKVEFANHTEETSTFMIGAFGRYFFTPENKFSFYGELGANYLSEENDNNGFEVILAPGISYELSEHIGLEASFGILSYKSVGEADAFEIGVDMEKLRFGILYEF